MADSLNYLYAAEQIFMTGQEIVTRLNLAYREYQGTILLGKPYAIHQSKQNYLNLMDEATRNFELIALDSMEHYEQLLGIQPALLALIKRKEEAVHKGDYETAAGLRDQEKEYILIIIAQNGMNREDSFFCHDGKVFYRTW